MPELTTMPAAEVITGGELIPGLQAGASVGLLAAQIAQAPRGAMLFARAPYSADTASTSDGDPGAGGLRWNHATPDAASEIYLSDVDVEAVDRSTLWAALAVGARLYVQRVAAGGIEAQQVWQVASVHDGAGYVALGVSLLAGHGSFAGGDGLQVSLQAVAAGVADAADIGYNNTSSGLAGATVQDALDEVAAAFAAAGGTIAVATPSIASGSLTLNFAGKSRYVGAVSLNANVTTLAFSGLPGAGFFAEYELHIKQDATGGRTFSLPASHRATGGSDTTIASAANSVTVVTASTVDNGVTWRYAMQEAGA